MQNIKLIACDIDGTLLQPGQTKITPEVFSQIRRLQQKGIRFCPASGRQYSSLRHLFAPVAEELYYLCENGSVIFDPKGNVLSKTVIPKEIAFRVIEKMLLTFGGEALISGENTSYLIPKQESYIRHIKEVVGNRVCVVSSVDEIPEAIIKLAMYCPMGAKEHLAAFEQAFGDQLQVAIAGECWLDLTLADKGTGIKALCDTLDIRLIDVMAIGDNFNDAAMLSAVGHPVIMENAAPTLKERFSHHCSKVEELLALL